MYAGGSHNVLNQHESHFAYNNLKQDSDKTSLKTHVKKMKSLTSFFVLSIAGSVPLLAPAIIYLIVDTGNLPNLTETNLQYLNSSAQNVTRASFFLSSIWNLYLVAYFLLQLLPLVVQKTMTLLYGFCDDALTEQLEYLPAIHKWLVNAVFMVFSVAIFSIIFSQYNLVSSWQIILSILMTLMVLSIMLLLQRILVQKIAYDFNTVAYGDRIKNSKHDNVLLEGIRKAIKKQGVVGKLDILTAGLTAKSASLRKESPDCLDPPPTSINTTNNVRFFLPPTRESLVKPPPVTGSLRRTPTIDTCDIPMGTSLDAPASPVPASPLMSRPTTSTPRQDAQDTIHSMNASLEQAVMIGGRRIQRKERRYLELSSENEAHRLAKRLFSALTGRSGAENITLDMFYPFFPTEEGKTLAFGLFDADGSGGIDQLEMELVIVKIFKEKRNLQASLNDLSQALGQLNTILYGFSGFFTLLCALPILGVSLASVIPLTSLVLGLSFVFGGSAKTTFDCIVFLFMTHPYDTGDRVLVNGVPYIVQELSLLITTFLSEGRTVYIPNSQLSIAQIINIRRSGDQTEGIMVQVRFDVSEVKMRKVHEGMLEFLKLHPAKFKGTCQFDLMEIHRNASCTYKFNIEHKGNWQDGVQRWTCRTMFMFALKANMEEQEIEFSVLSL